MNKPIAICVTTLAALLGAPAQAAQIILNEQSVIGSTGGYDSRFGAENIFDRQTGAISEVFGNGEYWLNVDGRANAFITIDLGAAYRIGSFDLFNSRNLGDRATGDFDIYAANSTAAATGNGATGMTLGSDATLLVSGTLARDPNSNSLAAQTFAALNSDQSYQYLQFRPRSTVSGSYSATSYGLNEMRVFETAAPVGAVPEPSTWAMMVGGFGMAGALMRSRRRAEAFS